MLPGRSIGKVGGGLPSAPTLSGKRLFFNRPISHRFGAEIGFGWWFVLMLYCVFYYSTPVNIQTSSELVQHAEVRVLRVYPSYLIIIKNFIGALLIFIVPVLYFVNLLFCNMVDEHTYCNKSYRAIFFLSSLLIGK